MLCYELYRLQAIFATRKCGLCLGAVQAAMQGAFQ